MRSIDEERTDVKGLRAGRGGKGGESGGGDGLSKGIVIGHEELADRSSNEWYRSGSSRQ